MLARPRHRHLAACGRARAGPGGVGVGRGPGASRAAGSGGSQAGGPGCGHHRLPRRPGLDPGRPPAVPARASATTAATSCSRRRRRPALGNIPPAHAARAGAGALPLAAWAAVRAAQRSSPRWWAAAGAASGLAFLASPVAGIVAVSLALAVAAAHRSRAAWVAAIPRWSAWPASGSARSRGTRPTWAGLVNTTRGRPIEPTATQALVAIAVLLVLGAVGAVPRRPVAGCRSAGAGGRDGRVDRARARGGGRPGRRRGAGPHPGAPLPPGRGARPRAPGRRRRGVARGARAGEVAGSRRARRSRSSRRHRPRRPRPAWSRCSTEAASIRCFAATARSEGPTPGRWRWSARPARSRAERPAGAHGVRPHRRAAALHRAAPDPVPRRLSAHPAPGAAVLRAARDRRRPARARGRDPGAGARHRRGAARVRRGRHVPGRHGRGRPLPDAAVPLVRPRC